MQSLSEIRDRVMTMEGADCRQELADTIEAIGELEYDFSILCREVASLSFNKATESYETSADFGRMCFSRGIKF